MNEPGTAFWTNTLRLRAAPLLLVVVPLGCSTDEDSSFGMPGSGGAAENGGAGGGASGGRATGAGGSMEAGRGGSSTTTGGGAGKGAGGQSGGRNTGGSQAAGEAGDGATGGSGGAAAGNTSTGGATGGGGAMTVEQFWEKFALGLCHHYMHCPGEPYRGNELRLSLDDSDERCAEFLVDDLSMRDLDVIALSEGVRAGVLHLSAVGVEACLGALAGCGYPWVDDPPEGAIGFRDLAPCREAFEGSVPEGGGCQHDAECLGDSRCVPSAGGECAGTCGARLAAEAPCARHSDCGGPIDAGTWPLCHTTGCVVRIPNEPSPLDDDCALSAPMRPTPCVEDSWCQDSTCTAPFESGAVCTDNLLGECRDGACSDGSYCLSMQIQSAAGDPCDSPQIVCDKFQGLSCIGGECAEDSGASTDICDDVWFYLRLCPSETPPPPIWCAPE